MLNWLKKLWNSYIFPWFQGIWQERKPEIEEEFQKEKQEMKEDVPKATKTLWHRLKELIE